MTVSPDASSPRDVDSRHHQYSAPRATSLSIRCSSCVRRQRFRRLQLAPAEFAAVALLLFASPTFAQAPPSAQPPGELKKLSLDELQTIEVMSVSKRPEKLLETASAIQVITADDIRRSGATSLPEALRLASNLQVAQVDSRSWAISARGFNSTSANKLLVLIDGRVVYTPLHAAVFWEVQDTLLDDVDRIEVISGPGATLWGANAVNGVINIITKAAADTQGILVTGGGGSELHGVGGVRYGGAVGTRAHFRAYGKFFGRGNSALTDRNQATDNWNLGQGGFRLEWNASPVDRFTVQGDVYDGRIAQRALSDITVSGGNVLGRWSRTLSKNSDFALQMYYDRTHRTMPGTFGENLHIFDADFQHHVRVAERHDIVWGLGYRVDRDDVRNIALLTFLPAQVSQQWFSGFVQDEMPLANNRLHLTLGTKIEHNDYTGVEVEPGARLGWTLTDRHMLWGAISRAVRMPSRIDRDLFAPSSPPFLLAGGSGFVSEGVLAYELGYRSRPQQRLSLAVATFYNDYDNLRSAERINPPAPFPIVIANGQTGTSYGAELTAEYRASDWWRLRSGYTGLRLNIRPKPGSTDQTFGSSESHDPNHQWFLRQSLDLPAHVQFDFGFRHVSRIANQTVPAYSELDARLGWQATRTLEWSIVGQNLLHDHHAEFGPSVTRREVERGAYVKLAWRF
jgi:iron complex outermembrane receptor protein